MCSSRQGEILYSTHSEKNALLYVSALTFHFQLLIPTFRSLSFLRLHSSHSLTMRPHRIQVSSSRCDRLDEAEELDTSEEPLFRLEPLIDRMDLESASSSLHEETVNGNRKLKLHKKAHNSVAQHVCLRQEGTHWRDTGKLSMNTRSNGRQM